MKQSLLFFAALLLLAGETDDMGAFVVSKILGFILFVMFLKIVLQEEQKMKKITGLLIAVGLTFGSFSSPALAGGDDACYKIAQVLDACSIQDRSNCMLLPIILKANLKGRLPEAALQQLSEMCVFACTNPRLYKDIRQDLLNKCLNK